MIPPPYLLYLGDSQNELSVKTSRGVAYWRPEWSLGEHRRPDCTVTLGLPHLGFAEAAAKGAKTLIVGVANAGGVLGPKIVADVVAALEAGLHVASGLHERLTEHPEIVAAAERRGLSLFDVREPPKKMAVGNGRPRAGHRLLTVGTDCSVGKMYTTLAVEREMRGRGMAADFRATGQTGIFIAQSGVPIDAVIADFISGAVEWLAPAHDPDHWDLIEGQGSLYHASYAGVSLGLLHGAQADVIVIGTEANRPHMRGLPTYKLPSLKETIELNLRCGSLTNPAIKAGGITANTSMLSEAEAQDFLKRAEDETGLPATDPVRFGVGKIVDFVAKL
jgi:uncharacterized NAD-dependent epimerase/dehydratase family protein